MTSLQIGKAIKELLLSNSNLVNKISDKVYPLIADQSTTYPFIIYRRAALVESSNKDMRGDEIQVEVYVVSDTYDSSIQIAELVRKSVEGKKGKFGDFKIEDIYITDAVESYEDNAFVQMITLKIQLI